MANRRRSTALIVAAALWVGAAATAHADTWSDTTPTDPGPEARVGLAGNPYDATNDRLIVFGGDEAGGLPRPTDTWVLHNATGIGGAPAWDELATSGGPPTGRFNQTAVYAPSSNSLIVYGGCAANCSPVLSDTWVLSNANGSGGTPQWSSLAPSGSDGREGHAAVYDDAGNRMVIFGGQNGFNTYASNPQVRVLSNADGSDVDAPTWTTLAPIGPGPSDRESSGAAYDAANNRMIVFGGATLACCAVVTDTYNDVWVLSDANGLGGPAQWTELAPTGTPPDPRFQAATVYDPVTNRLIVFGGVAIDDSSFDDVWVLTNANGLGGTPEWIELTPSGGPPTARWGSAAGYHPTFDAMVVAMGRTGGTLLDDSWVLEDANGVSYSYSGFFSPVNNQPTVNKAKAGAAIPVKFSLGGDQGLDIFVAGYPKSRTIDCDTSLPVDGVESTLSAGSSTLVYDASTDQYSYVWKTGKAWSGTCRRLEVRLDDGTVHTATFMFK